MNFPFKNCKEFRNYCADVGCTSCKYSKECSEYDKWDITFKKLRKKYSLKSKLKKLLA